MADIALHTFQRVIRRIIYGDRFLTEALASWVSLGVGILALCSQSELATRASLAGFREMPFPEVWIAAMSVGGVYVTWQHIYSSDAWIERWGGFLGMLTFPALSLASILFDFTNWQFWTGFALLLGLMQGCAVLAEHRDLRWGCGTLGTFFWINLAATFTINTTFWLPIEIALYWGWAAANALSVSRLATR